jgi:hypothetical protein
MRLRWAGEGEPTLGDIAFQVLAGESNVGLMQRGFQVVGVEEPDPGKAWGIVLERIAFNDAIRLSLTLPWWPFYRDRR